MYRQEMLVLDTLTSLAEMSILLIYVCMYVLYIHIYDIFMYLFVEWISMSSFKNTFWEPPNLEELFYLTVLEDLIE